MKYNDYIQNRSYEGDGLAACQIITGKSSVGVAEAYQLRDSMNTAAVDMTDATASKCAPLFPWLKGDGSLIKAGTRVNWNGKVIKATADLWDNVQNDPDHAPNLWEELEYRDGIRIIPEVISVTKAFSRDELGWWGDDLYRSLVDTNVYTPAQYAPNWARACACG